MNQTPGGGSAGVSQSQPKQKVRARRGQATDPHSIAERVKLKFPHYYSNLQLCLPTKSFHSLYFPPRFSIPLSHVF